MPAKQETLFHLETSWTTGLMHRKGGDWAPNESVRPFLEMMCIQWGTNYVYRQVHSLDDLEAWSKAIALAHKSTRRFIWLSGHGGGEKAFRFNRGTKASECGEDEIFRAIFAAGRIEGLVVDSCGFGRRIETLGRIPGNAQWVLATVKDVDFMDSSFVFAKSIYWIAEESPSNFYRGFENGMQTDHEKKKSQVNFQKVVETMGVRLYFIDDKNLRWIPKERTSSAHP